MRFFLSLLFLISISTGFLFSKSIHYAELDYIDVVEKSRELLEQHASFHEMNDEIAKRILERFLFEIDPFKISLIQSEVQEWLEPTAQLLHDVRVGFSNGNFFLFQKMVDRLAFAWKRYESLEKISLTFPRPEHVTEKDMKKTSWAVGIPELLMRIRMVQALEENVLNRFEPEAREKAKKRFEKRKKATRDLLISSHNQEKVLSTLLLKSFAESLDSQTNYFTPGEANEFVIAIQQKLYGIGVLFRDDIDGLTVLQIVEGGPADRQGQLKVNDKVIAVDSEPVVGMDLYDVIEMIRGEEDTPVRLRILRETGDKAVHEKDAIDLTIKRGAVVVRDARLKSTVMPSSAGALGYLHLSSFYQDDESSSGEDMRQALLDLMNKEPLAGVILDLRGNPGGILQQAVEVCGLFMDSALICSVKEGKSLYPFWNLSPQKIWDGPLVVLVDRTSASASEIVAQAFQDWGRAIIIGDDRTFGKGSFQILSFGADTSSSINPKGEYKISKGRYYTASGKSPQLVGVSSDIEVCSPYRFMEVGEQYSAYPLSSECIPSYFDGASGPSSDDIEKSFSLKEEIKNFFSKTFFSQPSRFQKKQDLMRFLLPSLQDRSRKRMKEKEEYQHYLNALQSNASFLSDKKDESEKKEEDFACQEAVHVLEDMVQISSYGMTQVATKQAA